MTQSKVKQIGKNAIDTKDKMLILFGEEATEELRKVSIIQEFISKDEEIELIVGSKIKFDSQEYTITYVGRVANEHLNSMGHLSVLFKENPEEDALLNAIYVEPYDFPQIKEGTVITYK